MKDQPKAEALAAERMQLLAPLLAEGLDPTKAREMKRQICEQTGLSERTLRRYMASYRSEGFTGLKPKGKGRHPSEEAIPSDAWSMRSSCAGRSPAAAWHSSFRFWNGKAGLHPVKSIAARFRND
ncbi:hypothetical protein GCM10010912_66490 [Paenibacillus albidus]|uniref:Uncharacterized protein n=1 Tax=Paenibacillus albidus TaxID=2041023 RepID=A0A917D835_9BACL|nr:helix-turn-helix domain-containing protein [Paenibacillus albidus]GGG12792.1 hypothetical protein GCM10010912_66490 [Paenibacillus albidus]